jgi:hypothetical protein
MMLSVIVMVLSVIMLMGTLIVWSFSGSDAGMALIPALICVGGFIESVYAIVIIWREDHGA